MKEIILSISVILIAFSCKQAPTGADVSQEEEVSSIPDEFRAFYDRFHEDTSYQIDHITFPLAGLPANADTLSTPVYHWKRDNWRWHRAIDPNLTGYERAWQLLTDEMIVETIIQTTSGIGMERRFAKIDDEWQLIYYAAMNPMK
ncbi:MAG: hypothetical protein KDC80_02220 [Saprospiraceae bacterium]|nr:hypothetical protein [Saprospiraceae bacterium]